MFELWPKISLSEKEFFTKNNLLDQVDSIREKIIKKDGYKCRGCQIPGNQRKLNVHIVEEDEKNPLNSSFVCLCNECHIIEHIDKAIDKGYVVLVNSSFKQSELVSICRSNQLKENINNGKIDILKKEPEVYLNEMKSGSLGKNRIKIIFNPKKYPW